MQAMPVMAVMPKNPGNAAQSAGAGNESVAAEGINFPALLMAQIKGEQGGAKVEVLLDADDVKSALADIAAPQESKSLPGGEDGLVILDGHVLGLPQPAAQELTPADGLIPVAGVFVPAQAVVAQQPQSPVLTAVHLGGKIEETKLDSDVLDQVDKGLRNTNATLSGPGRQAEFAVDGKMLPQNLSEKSGEKVSLPLLSAEPQRTPETLANTLPAMMVANHSAVIETKAMPLPPVTIQTPVGTTGWGDAFGQKVVWMAGQQTQVAELHLNPPHLGPMEVRLSVSNDQVSALFVSHQPAVREAIEAAMPRLREMFADSGMSLGNATVSSDSLPQQSQAGREGYSGSSRQPDFSAIGDLHPLRNLGGAISLRHDGSGMVDLFA